MRFRKKNIEEEDSNFNVLELETEIEVEYFNPEDVSHIDVKLIYEDDPVTFSNIKFYYNTSYGLHIGTNDEEVFFNFNVIIEYNVYKKEDSIKDEK